MSRNKGSVKNKVWFKLLIAIVVLGIFGGAGYLAANMLLNNTSQVENTVPVEREGGIPVTLGSVSKTINVTGNLLPAQQEAISVSNGSTINKLYYWVGARIEKDWDMMIVKNDSTNATDGNTSSVMDPSSMSSLSEANSINSGGVTSDEPITLKSHINGKVEEVNVVEKQVVTDSTKPAILIIDDSSFTLKTTINETDIVSVYPDQVANIRLKAFPDEVFTGKVKQIDATGTVGTNGKTAYGVQIVLDTVHEKFKTGMTGEADLFVSNVDNVFMLPLNAIVLTGGGVGEVTVEDEAGNLVTKEVTVGLVGNDTVEIISGLEEGEKVYIEKVTEEQNIMSMF